MKASNTRTRLQKKKTTQSTTRGGSSFTQRALIAFVSFHLFAIFVFAMPIEIAPARALRDLLAPYMRCIGMNERWDTFAPNPKTKEQFLKAIVITKSGHTLLYPFPRMEELSFGERYRKERYRKFVESATCSECSSLWLDIEKTIVRNNADPNDPPARVILVKFESPIDPRTGAVGTDAAATRTALSELTVQPGDLR